MALWPARTRPATSRGHAARQQRANAGCNSIDFARNPGPDATAVIAGTAFALISGLATPTARFFYERAAE
jgi:hypothetical protein